jgi:hypothetical protein
MKKFELRQLIKEEIRNVITEDVKDKAKKFIKANHNPGEEEDHITYEYSKNKIDKDIVDYINKNKRLDVTVNGQGSSMTLKGGKVVVEFY